ncbi:heat shock protein HslJ [Pluralibacter gergoviae]
MNNKKLTFAVLVAGMMLASCVSYGTKKVTVQKDQLIHHRFVLETVNGENLPEGVKTPELNFNEGLHISGAMCNQFTGQASLSEGVLKAKKVAMTRKLCTDPQLNQLDATISKMLHDGAQVDLTENQLTLATATDSLIYKLADRVQ